MAYYDSFSSKKVTGVGRYIAVNAAKRFVAAVRAVNPAPVRVLEIGPGGGDIARHYASTGAQYSSFEPNETLRNALRESGISCRPEAVPPIPEQSDSFDLIIISHVLEHMSGPEKASLLISECARVLSPRGSVAVVSPDFTSWGTDFYDSDYTHAYPVTATRLSQLFVDSGLQTVGIGRIYGCFGRFPGWLIDRMVRVLALAIRWTGASEYRTLKARLSFHANVLAIARKPQ